MRERPIEVGSVVRLKEGGPQMVVRYVAPSGWILCVWHDTKAQPHQDMIRVELLKLVKTR